MSHKMIYKGSVKNIFEEGEYLRFEFSDRYSLFDWGAMPDELQNKGKALAQTAALFFDEFEKMGIKHHLIRYQNNELWVQKFQVLKQKNKEQKIDYTPFQMCPTRALIPLEVIFRFGASTGSSIPERIENHPELLRQWGLKAFPLGQQFEIPIIDFSTKFEKQDRYLNYHEAKKIAALSDQEFNNLIQNTSMVALKIKNLVEKMGLTLWDGKLEWAFGDFINGQRELILVDSVGLDELRLELHGKAISKEFLRQFYKNSSWYKDLASIKKQNIGREIDLRKECLSKPENLPLEIKATAENLYMGFANELATQCQKIKIFDAKYGLKNFDQRIHFLTAKNLKVLILGKGGREAAIADKISQSPLVSSVIVAPGNPAMPRLNKKITCISQTKNLDQYINLRPDLVIIGPEDLLAEGIVDVFEQHNILVVGPTKAASLLESSKIFCKEMFMEAQIPTAKYFSVKNLDEGRGILTQWDKKSGLVIKADGLCQGKGVVVCDNPLSAENILQTFFDGNFLGKKVNKVLIEERLYGQEASAFALCDGYDFVFLGTATDYKRLGDNDQGPNTGGMGAISPAPFLTKEDDLWIQENVFKKILTVMRKRGTPFKGFLFAGLMKTQEGIKVIEINTRLGDPETQSLLPRINVDLVPYLVSAALQKLATMEDLPSNNSKAVHVVLAAHGYPGVLGMPIRSGDKIQMSPLETNCCFYPAGLDIQNEQLVTAGGRVGGVTALGKDLAEAVYIAYQNIQKVNFSQSQFRKDIGRNFL